MDQAICKMMHKGALLHKRFMTKVLERFEITFPQYQVIKIIKDQPGITAKEVLSYLDTDKATLSGILHRLEKNDMIFRKVDANDRRIMHIHLTKFSKIICAQVGEIEDACEADLLMGLKNREIKYFFDAFNHVLDRQIEKLEIEENEEKL